MADRFITPPPGRPPGKFMLTDSFNHPRNTPGVMMLAPPIPFDSCCCEAVRVECCYPPIVIPTILNVEVTGPCGVFTGTATFHHEGDENDGCWLCIIANYECVGPPSGTCATPGVDDISIDMCCIDNLWTVTTEGSSTTNLTTVACGPPFDATAIGKVIGGGGPCAATSIDIHWFA